MKVVESYNIRTQSLRAVSLLNIRHYINKDGVSHVLRVMSSGGHADTASGPLGIAVQ